METTATDVDIFYKPLTAINKIIDTDLPEFLRVGGRIIKVPEALREKQVSYRLLSDLGLTKTAWIHKGLAHLLNSRRQSVSNKAIAECLRSVVEVDKEISGLVRDGVLRDRQGPGAMSFSQAHEEVPEDAVVISARSFAALCKSDPRWQKAKRVLTVRFPNLGPNTTQSLRLIVNQNIQSEFSDTSLAFRLPELRELKALYDDLLGVSEEPCGTIDAFYFNPKTLKEGFAGDCDGDILFVVIDEKGSPEYREFSFERAPGDITQAMRETLLRKADRVERVGTSDWLKKFLDVNLVGRATYIIRWETYKLLDKYADDPHPMYRAWQEISPWAIELIEFIMDIRKGDFTEKEIAEKMAYIDSKHQEINTARKNGNWFAMTVTAQSIEDVGAFVDKFSTLQSFASFITRPPEKLTLSDLM